MNKIRVAKELLRLAKQLTGGIETAEDAYKDFARGLKEVINGLENEIAKAEGGWASVDYLEEKIGVLSERLGRLKMMLKNVPSGAAKEDELTPAMKEELRKWAGHYLYQQPYKGLLPPLQSKMRQLGLLENFRSQGTNWLMISDKGLEKARELGFKTEHGLSQERYMSM